jgi:hypothetical protein
MLLSSVDPRCGTTDGGIFGTRRRRGFTAGANLAFNGVPATDLTLVDDTILRVRVPAAPPDRPWCA